MTSACGSSEETAATVGSAGAVTGTADDEGMSGGQPGNANGGAAGSNLDPTVSSPEGGVIASAGGGNTNAGSRDAGTTDPTQDPTTPSNVQPGGPLELDSGCSGVFNPDQILDLHLTLDQGDWQSILADTTYALVVQASFRCNDEPDITVGVRRKRSGGNQKVGLKIDMNEFVVGQRHYGLRTLSLENGVSSGDNTDGAGVGALVSEYLGWRLFMLSGAISGRAAMSRVFVNDQLVGVYVNVEQVDKTFLQARLGDDNGWLYKKSGGVNDGLKTHEVDMLDDPYDDYFCFFSKGGGSCAVPSAAALASDLPTRLDIPQFLRMGAVNAIIANSDAPLFKDNNYYWYDWTGGGRIYLPWDLDTSMNANVDVFTGGVGGQVDFYTDVAFSNWEDDYQGILQELLDSRFTLDTINTELDRVESVAGSALDGDPYTTGDAGSAVASLKGWWMNRLVEVQGQLDSH
ncbi:MAG TPA: CotH kinase family protein [Polyangiaceae bacterium]|nr:CotH kinase family protein [Polyangiaceae bacterium]